MACVIDWRLVLEFAKVLATPVGAIVIAALGLHFYKAQRRVDRRFAWYEQLHSLLGRTADLYRWAGAAHAAGDEPRATLWTNEANAVALSLSERTAEVFIYGLEVDFVALRRLEAISQTGARG